MISNHLFSVRIYIHGENLDPLHVSQQLGVRATRSHYKGQKIVTSSNREIIKKAGLWALRAMTKSENLSDHIDELAKLIKVDGKFIEQVDGVEDAYVDIFASKTLRKEEDDCAEFDCTEFEFELSKENIIELNRLGLPITVTVNLVLVTD